MPNVVVKGSPATCGHPATGASKVFAEGKAIIKVGDTAGSIIIGPGNPTVFIEGSIVSVVGDTITPHDSKPTHKATTTSICGTVFSR